MKTLKIIGIIVITLLVVVSTALFLIGYFKPKDGGIRIETEPAAEVYLDGALTGKTPFQKTRTPGQITLRLEPEASTSALLAYETKINIAAGIETVVRRQFGVDEESSSGDVISFEKLGGKDASLVVISTPDNAQVTLDGTPRGFTPYKNSTLTVATHQITVRANGFNERTLTVNTVQGYQLNVFVKLAKSQEVIEPPPSPSPSPTPSTFIEILDTPTGFLRVRTQPGTSGEEIAEVKPGEKYPYLETDESSGWFKIQYQSPRPGLPEGIVGWVSNQYSKKIEEVRGPSI